ncbi:MAG: N-acetylneuraminate synthase family protein [Candidatus Nitrosopumilus sp. bin_68KS]
MVSISIDGKKIGDGFPCYTIAEAGANHDGTLDKALKLIDAAKEANSDSIKFQTYKAEKLTTKTAPKYWEDGNSKETQYDVFSKLDHLTNNEWKEIFEYAKSKSITCFSTPFDEESVNLLYSLDTPAFKIASADITHIPLIKLIAKKRLPIFISTGMAADEEINYAIKTIENEGNHDIVIMHCITSYPTEPKDANLSMIKTLKEKFPNYVIGYSDHTIGTNIGVYSTFYGSTCIEKHFTFDSALTESPDHRLSLDIKGFKRLVDELRIAEISKGEAIRNEFDSEKEAIKYARRSIVSTRKINEGEKISKEMLDVKRPGTGIPPKFFDEIIGKIVKKEIDEDQPIQWDNVYE